MTAQELSEADGSASYSLGHCRRCDKQMPPSHASQLECLWYSEGADKVDLTNVSLDRVQRQLRLVHQMCLIADARAVRPGSGATASR